MNILSLSVQASPLIAAILLSRTILLHRLPRRTFPLLWWVAALRLLTPFALPCTLSVFALGRQAAGAQTTAAPAGMPADALSLVPLTQGGVDVPGISPAAVIWALGALACAAFFLAGHARALRRYRTALPVGGQGAQWLRAQTRHPISLRAGGSIVVPLTYGVLRPVILLPSPLLALDSQTLRFVLAHELCHIRRMDVLFRWICAGVLCLHWFNPLAWAFFLFACRDMEMACDEAVVRSFGPGCRTAYARALLHLEASRCRPSPLFSGFSKTAIEERIVSIMRFKKLTVPALVSALALGAFITTVFATSAPPAKCSIAAEAPASSNATATGADLLWPTNPSFSPTLTFGERVHPITGEVRLVDHITISGPDAEGSGVYAALSGTVTFAGWAGEAGHRVELSHENGLTTVYAHCSDIAVRAGDTVAQGEVIATLGATGNVTGPCLAFGVAQDGTAVDPLSFFPDR